VLLERGDELGRLRAALARARRREGTLVLVSGEAGIGKTSLVREFAAEVQDSARVLAGACDDLLSPRALGPFRDLALQAGLAVPAHPDRDGYLDVLLAELGFALRPAVVIVEDAHWADDASLDILRYLGRRVERMPVLLVVTYRAGELGDGHPLRRVLGSFPAASTLRLELAGLSGPTVARLAEQAGVDPDRLVAAAGGNPFYVTEILAAPGDGVPATVRDAVAGRIRTLPGPTQRALEALSVVPGQAEVALLDGVVAGGVAALAPAERVGMVAVRGGSVRFRHELARRAVEESLLGARRVELNRAVLAALRAAGAEPSRLVHHAAAAGDSAALGRLAPVAAEEAAAAEAHSETVALGRLALRHADPGDAETTTRMHGLAAYALYALNRFGEAAAHADQAVRAGAAGPPLELGRALLLSSRMRTMVGDPVAARDCAQRAVAILEPLGESADLAHAYGQLGSLDAIEADSGCAAERCRRAVAGARAAGRVDVEAHALIYLGIARVGLGDEGGLEDLRAAIGLGRRIDHGDYLCRAAADLASALIWLGRHPEALPWLAVAEDAARDHGLDLYLFHVLAQRSHVELFLGRWDSAERRLREQLATAGDPGSVLAIPLALLGRVLARRGDPAATAMVARAWDLAVRSRQVHRMAVAGSAVVEEAWLRGDAATVRAAAAELVPVAARSRLVYLQGETLRCLRRVGVEVVPFDRCPAGFAAGIRGDWRAAAAAWSVIGNPYEEALELSEAPDSETAFEGLRRLDDLGAVAAAALVRRRLQARGPGVPRGPQRATRRNPARLTTRQLAVLTLLADGLTNAQIAERLVLSRRTVDNHVTAVLARLGVSGRREAVAVAVAAGWLGADRSGQLPAGEDEPAQPLQVR
jgi:DNA-binding CsgD family transcriptional regulator/tetratricopeptide (TPR) repeat protein